MSIRQLYEALLIECNKLKAPALLLEDYIYVLNKGIQQYVNLAYNRAEYNQQSSDDLGWLQTKIELKVDKESTNTDFDNKIYVFNLPKDYLHMLGCKAQFTSTGNDKNKCGNSSVRTKVSNCSRLTSDLDGGVANNYYFKPSEKKPYYHIITTDFNSRDTAIENGSGYKPSINKGDLYNHDDLKEPYDRTSNQYPVKLEIHIGNSR